MIHLAESAIETLPLFRLVSPQGSSAPELRVALRTFISVDRGQSATNILDTIETVLFATAPLDILIYTNLLLTLSTPSSFSTIDSEICSPSSS